MGGIDFCDRKYGAVLVIKKQLYYAAASIDNEKY